MSFFEDNKEKVNSISALIEEAAECEDQEMLIETLENIPESFWKDKECSTKIMETFLDCIKFDFSVYPIEFIPDFFWEEAECVWSYVVTLCEFYDEERIDYNWTELLPRNILNDKKIFKLLLYYNYEEMISYLPEEYQNDQEIIFEALDGLERWIERRENCYNSMVCPLDKRECLEYFISQVPRELFLNNNFVISLLKYDLFSCEVDLLYHVLDEKLWSDKEFVLKVLQLDEETPLAKMSKELMSDNEFMTALDEIIDVYELGCEFLDNGDDRGMMCMLYAAQTGNDDAQLQLAECYRDGNGVEKNLAEAEKGCS